MTSPKKQTPVLHHKKGKGKKLGDIAYISNQINKRTRKDEQLRSFHSLVLGRVNKETPIKENLREFSGVYYADKETDRAKYEAKLAKWPVAKIKDVLIFLGQETSGKRDELVDRMMDFIEKPSKATVEHQFSPIKKRKASDDVKPRKKRRTKVKDPDAPKRALSAYMYYCNAHREEAKKNHPNEPVTVIASALAKMYKKATPDELKKFQKKAAKDKERYKTEREAYLAKKEAEKKSSSSSSSSDSDSSSSSDSE